MPKEQNLKDYLEGNELDLSLHNLTAVPVKELAAIPKATNLDLSCNKITYLPDSFCSLLTHVIKIDLSKNILSDLPDNFGSLINLQHLDLLGNRLTTLPVSICQLQKLKWLDLKDNPLDEELKKTAGDCLDEKQCRQCAQKILQYMKNKEVELEKKRKKKEAEKRGRENAKKLKEEKERERKKEEKQVEKAKKRQEYEAQKANQNLATKHVHAEESVEEIGRSNSLTTDKEQVKSGVSVCESFCYLFLTVMFMLIAIVVGVYYVCESDTENEYCKTYWQQYKQSTNQYLTVYLKPVTDITWKMFDSVCLQLKQIMDNFTDGPSSNNSFTPEQSANTK